jgi:uncharacterized membrane protein YidH (DUF202 family)
MNQDLQEADTNTALARERTELARERTELARHRTAMSADRTHWADDRTLIAWVRTSLSLIGFGFGIGRALEYLQEVGRKPDPLHTAKVFGGGFILFGMLVLLAAIIQHIRVEKRLRKSGYPRIEPMPLGLLTATLLLLMGVYGLVVVLLNP